MGLRQSPELQGPEFSLNPSFYRVEKVEKGKPFGDNMSKPRALYDLLKLSSLGLEMGAAVVIGLLCGTWLDNRFDTTPWLTLLFLGFGFAAAAKGVIRALRKGIFEDENDVPPE